MERKRIPEKYFDLTDKQIAIQLQSVINDGLKIAKRNYNYAVPQYRPKTKNRNVKIQFLLPIYLDNDFEKEADFALALNSDKHFYTPETILELSWAYRSARVLCKLDKAWLRPEKIKDSDEDDEHSDFSNGIV